jgi:hypothetical protein
MSLSFPITLPTSPLSRSITIRPRAATGALQNPFTYTPQVQVWGGQRWEADVELPPMPRRADAEAWIAVLTGLNFQEGSFLLGDTANPTARGAATGTPLVNGASQSGYDLVTDGWTAGVTGILKAGDWIQLGSGSTARLYKVMVDANSDGAGNATLTLWPRLRSSPADNAAIVVSSAKGVFMLAEVPEWSIDYARKYGLSFKAIEDLR